jgi:hypothetical protein
MKFKFLVLLLIICNLSLGQRINNKNNWIVKANVSSFFDMAAFPSVQLSVEKKISQYVSMSLEAGYQLYSFRHSDTSFLNPEGFKAGFELRYFLPRFLKGVGINPVAEGIYTGFRPFYRQYQYNAYVPVLMNPDHVRHYEDNFASKNKVYGFCFLFGFQRSVYKKIIFDLYSGAGIMNRQIENTGLQYDKASGDIIGGTGLMQFMDRFKLSESSGIWPSFSFGFRIGYKF